MPTPELRYWLFKHTDVEAALTPEEIEQLRTLGRKVAAYRTQRGAPRLNALVVEHDWPVYPAVRRELETWIRQTECKHEWSPYFIAGEGDICTKCHLRDLTRGD